MNEIEELEARAVGRRRSLGTNRGTQGSEWQRTEADLDRAIALYHRLERSYKEHIRILQKQRDEAIAAAKRMRGILGDSSCYCDSLVSDRDGKQCAFHQAADKVLADTAWLEDK